MNYLIIIFPTKGEVQKSARWIIPKMGPNSAALAPFCLASMGKKGAWILATNPHPMLRTEIRHTEMRVSVSIGPVMFHH